MPETLPPPVQGWVTTPPPPPAATSFGLDPATFGQRLGAYVVDGLILLALSIPLWVIGGIFVAADWHTYPSVCRDPDGFLVECTALTDATAARLFATIAVGVVAMLLVSVYYWGHFEGRRGATPGKRKFGIQVVDQADGRPIGFGRAVGRLFSRVFSNILLLGYLWMLWDPQKETWHDKIVGSTVVKVPQ
jgi:uncharacterized RDD family membrane protein YckC